jgi:hypothetical protein
VDTVAAFLAYEGIPAQKAIMKMMGLDLGGVRAPLTALTDAEYDDLKQALTDVGFFDFSPHTVGVEAGEDCSAGSEDLCSCSELIRAGAIASFDDCTQEAAIDYCQKHGACA